jgi:hypothetical protein
MLVSETDPATDVHMHALSRFRSENESNVETDRRWTDRHRDTTRFPSPIRSAIQPDASAAGFDSRQRAQGTAFVRATPSLRFGPQAQMEQRGPDAWAVVPMVARRDSGYRS